MRAQHTQKGDPKGKPVEREGHHHSGPAKESRTARGKELTLQYGTVIVPVVVGT